MKHEQEPKPQELRLAGLNAIRQIDKSDLDYNEHLAGAMLCAAWPSIRAQNQ